MGFLSSAYRQQLDSSSSQQKSGGSSPSSKPANNQSTAQKVGGFLNAAGRMVFGNTAKAINQGYQEGKQVVDTTRELAASATNNPTAYKNASNQSQQDYQGFKKTGGLFNAGTFNSQQEAQKGDFKSGAEKIGAGTVGVATELLPFARGAGVAGKTGIYTARGVEAANDVSKVAKGIAAARVLGEGAGYGVVNSGVDSVENGTPLTPSSVAQNALIGAGSAGLGSVVSKVGGKVIGKIKGDAKDVAPTVDTSPQFNNNELDQFLPKNIPVNQAEDSGVLGKVTQNGLPTTTPEVQPAVAVPISDTDFRAKFKSGANDAAKLPQMADTFAKTGSKDAVTNVLSNLSNAKSMKNGQITQVVAKLIPDLSREQNRELASKIKDTTNENTIKELLNGAAQNTQANPTPIKPATNISFDGSAGTPTDTNVPQSKQVAAALVGNGDTASTYIPVKQGDFVEPPLTGSPEALAAKQVAGDTTSMDTRVTSPEAAQSTIALSRVDNPSASVSAPVTATRAQAALVGEKPDSISVPVDAPTTNVGKGAQSIARTLDDQLSTFSGKYKAPEELLKKLEGSDAVSTPTRSNDWLDHYEDTLGVLGRHFGKVGTDLGYKLAEGAKQVSDLQSTVRPAIDKAQSILDKLAKSKTGRADVQGRIYSALEDRANANNILQGKQEKELYNQVVSVFDYFKQQRIDRGKSVVGEDYSPRAAVRNALDAPDRLLNNAQSAFSTDTASKFSKTRVSEIPDAEINRNIVDLLPTYVSSQAKEFGYEGAMQYAKDNLQKVNPAYITDGKSYRQGEDYVRNLFQQVLDPRSVSKSERFQNKLIANTYRNQLGFSLKYAAQNLTQRFATMANVTHEAKSLAGKIDKTDLDVLRKGSLTSDTTNSAEALQSGDNTLGTSDSKIDSFFKRFDPGAKTEKSNIHNSFDLGASQAIVESQPYKDAIKAGLKPQLAAKQALQDESVRDMAIRRGNVVTNDTQFGANYVTKPEFFRNSGTFFGLSDKWFKQYQRFPQGMIQQMTTILHGNDARALDILRRGNPAETNLVDYRKSAEALSNGVDEVIKGIKAGEVHDVSLEVAQGYKDSLQKATKELNDQMKKVSLIRGHKTAAAFGKMWAAAAAIQFVFDGGSDNKGSTSGEIGKDIKYGAPLSIPTKDQNPLSGAFIPSSPIGKNGIRWDKVANLVPGVGLAVNRGKEVKKFYDALTGDNKQ